MWSLHTLPMSFGFLSHTKDVHVGLIGVFNLSQSEGVCLWVCVPLECKGSLASVGLTLNGISRLNTHDPTCFLLFLKFI